MKKLFIIGALLFATVAFGEYCLTAPSPISKGSSCPSSSSFCKPGLFCDHTQTCSPVIEDGQKCFSRFGGCKVGSTCKGPENNEICVKNSGPGQSCNSADDVTTPSCGSGLSCLEGKCTGGRYGDRCGANVDCRSNVCTDLICSIPNPVLNATCTAGNGIDYCGKDFYCQQGKGFFNPSSCQPRVAAGAECTGNDMCPIKHSCARKENKPDALRYCIAESSLDAGAYHDGREELCKSGIGGPANHCGEIFPEYCGDIGGCGTTGVCTCGSRLLTQGNGECKKNACLERFEKAEDCLYEKCLTDDGEMSYDTSCLSVNCLELFNDARKCFEDKYSFNLFSIN